MLAKLRYRFDTYMSWRASARFLLVLALGLVALLLGALLLRLLAPGAESAANFPESLWWSWGRVADPGSGAGDVGTGVRAAEVITTLAGLFLFALLIGFVSSGVEDKLGELRKGRSQVVEEGHVLILGFGEKTLRLLTQLAEANARHRDACVVILSTQEKEAVMDAVLARFGGPKVGTTRIVVRNGEPWSVSDLANVGICEAKSIVLLSEDGTEDDDGDVRVVKSLLAITRGMKRPVLGHVVVELRDSAHRDVVEAIGGDKIEIVVAEAFLARLMIQTARQSGLAQVYAELLSFVGDELYIVPAPRALVGKTFRDAWSTLPTTVVAGIEPAKRKPGQRSSVILAPPDDTVIEAGDQLIVLLPDDTTTVDVGEMSFDATLPGRASEATPRKAERYLLIGYEEDMGEMLEEIDHYVSEGSEVVVLTPLAVDEITRRLAPSHKRLTRLEVRYVQGDSTSRHDLAEVCGGGFDAEIVIADEAEARTSDDADARTLMTLLLLRNLARDGSRVSTSRVISEIKNPRTKDLAAIAEVGDFVVSDELVSDFLAQVAQRRELADVWAELCHAEGHEIYLKPAWRYAAPGESVSFADVTARARARGEVALGWKLAAREKEDLRKFGVAINPGKKERTSLGDDDCVIVIAASEN